MKASRWKVTAAWFVLCLVSLTDIKESRLMLSDVVKGSQRRKHRAARQRLIRQHFG